MLATLTMSAVDHLTTPTHDGSKAVYNADGSRVARIFDGSKAVVERHVTDNRHSVTKSISQPICIMPCLTGPEAYRNGDVAKSSSSSATHRFDVLKVPEQGKDRAGRIFDSNKGGVVNPGPVDRIANFER